MEHQPSDRGHQPGAALTDTIVAAATPAGRGGVAIVRVSGPGTARLAGELLGALPRERYATRSQFRAADGSSIDHGLALYFPAPHSYTGEQVLELHGHGGPVLVEALIRRVLQLGARRARPGEFTQRAYLNGKLDLAQAEAVADLIDAASEAAARAALRSLQGEFSRRVRALGETLAELRTFVEAGIDFADEPIDVLSDRSLQARLEAVTIELQALRDAGRQGRLLAEGMTIVIAGRPNAGKSSVLNRLAGHDAAIVTALPGTTRDLLRERIVLDGMPLQVLDTAGLRRANDAIEAEGIRRARVAMTSADRIVFIVDAVTDPQASGYLEEQAQLPTGVPVTLVFNKIDLLSGGLETAIAPARSTATTAPVALRVSALTGAGFDALAAHLKASMGFEPDGAGALAARARHLDALTEVQVHLSSAADQLSGRGAPELVAEELKRAQEALGEIVGPQSSEELLGRIFSRFCVGK